jgi:hypothetical protein
VKVIPSVANSLAVSGAVASSQQKRFRRPRHKIGGMPRYRNLFEKLVTLRKSGAIATPRTWNIVKDHMPERIRTVKTPQDIEFPEDKFHRLILARFPVLRLEVYDYVTRDRTIAQRLAHRMVQLTDENGHTEDQAFDIARGEFQQEMDDFEASIYETRGERSRITTDNVLNVYQNRIREAMEILKAKRRFG